MRIETDAMAFEIDLEKVAEITGMDEDQLGYFRRLFEEGAEGAAQMLIELFANLAVHGEDSESLKAVTRRWHEKYKPTLRTGPPPKVESLSVQEIYKTAFQATERAFQDKSLAGPLTAAYMDACDAAGIHDDYATASFLKISSKAKTRTDVATHVAAKRFGISTRNVKKHLSNPHAGRDFILSAPCSGLFFEPREEPELKGSGVVIIGAERTRRSD